VERRHTSDCRGRQHPLAEQRGTRKRMRPAAGEAGRDEPIDPEPVRDRSHVRGAVGRRSPGVARAPCVAWPRVRHVSQAALGTGRDLRGSDLPRRRCPRAEEDDLPTRGTRRLHIEQRTRPLNQPISRDLVRL
jgi:hypothetical protein